MSVTTNPSANRIYQEFSTEFLKSLDEAPRIWPALAVEVPSSSRSTLHAFLYDSASVREWKGSRHLNEMATLVWEVINRDWEISWKFKEHQIRDDLSGIVAQAIAKARSYAAKWARHEDQLVADTIQLGTTKPCYDGQNFFSATHPIDPGGVVSGTFSNLRTAKPLTAANLMTGLSEFRQMKNPDGSPAVGPATKIKLVYEASNEWNAKQLTTLGWYGGAAAGIVAANVASVNVLQGSVDPLYNPYMNDEAGVWYLAAEADGMKPIMFQRRQGVESDEVGPGSKLYFDRKEYQIGQDARYEASYTHPQLMQRNEPT